MTLAADVNPDTTGIDTNSTKNPKRKIPKRIVMHPDKKQSKAACSGIPLKKKKKESYKHLSRMCVAHEALLYTRIPIHRYFPRERSVREKCLRQFNCVTVAGDLLRSRDRMKREAGAPSIALVIASSMRARFVHLLQQSIK